VLLGCVRRGVGEPKEVSSNYLVRTVRCAVDTGGIDNLVLDVLGEVADGGISCVRKHVLNRLDETKLDEGATVSRASGLSEFHN
jgi:hypothetical protein